MIGLLGGLLPTAKSRRHINVAGIAQLPLEQRDAMLGPACLHQTRGLTGAGLAASVEDADESVAQLPQRRAVVQVTGALLVVVAAGAGRVLQRAERLTLEGLGEAVVADEAGLDAVDLAGGPGDRARAGVAVSAPGKYSRSVLRNRWKVRVRSQIRSWWVRATTLTACSCSLSRRSAAAGCGRYGPCRPARGRHPCRSSHPRCRTAS